MNRVECLDDRGHRFRRLAHNGSAHPDAMNRALDLSEAVAGVRDLSVVEESFEAEPIDRAAALDAKQLAGIRGLPRSPRGQPSWLSQQRPQDDAGVEIDDHRSRRSSLKRRSTSTGPLGRTPVTFLSDDGGNDAGMMLRSSVSCTGTIRAIGVSRSHTTTSPPARTSAR